MKTSQDPALAISNLGISALNPMQKAAEAAILSNAEILLLAPTGSGKTLGFLLPVLQLLKPEQKTVQCLILAPSRELALQIEHVWKKMGTGFKVNVCYGGHPMATEMQNLNDPPAVLIGTPGRIADHLDRRTFDPANIHTLVLDEFDKSLELGFHDQMAFIISHLSNLTKRVLVSATARVDIPAFVGAPSPIRLQFLSDDAAQPNLALRLVWADDRDKTATLVRLISSLQSEAALIFCNYRETVESLSQSLCDRGIRTAFYHGGLEQDERERALIQFRNGSVRYLITTDLAARGLDIPEMKHVIHVQLPAHEAEFLHRNGRTARMQATGTAYLLLHPDENRPSYLSDSLDELTLAEFYPLPELPDFQTIYISGGKKNKLNKVDIVGFFSQKGGLEKGDLGLIEVKDFSSFAAVRTTKVQALLAKIEGEKMKGKKYKIAVAR
ncbi:DEAD/DEAH box helicase [Larkinella sp. VNQ87]|uniref:DEAD/DEAH box helicase n=1 Tax=Larkinella sp. VNQ87 TaxID=3400921 RepID=UPI003C0F82DD